MLPACVMICTSLHGTYKCALKGTRQLIALCLLTPSQRRPARVMRQTLRELGIQTHCFARSDNFTLAQTPACATRRRSLPQIDGSRCAGGLLCNLNSLLRHPDQDYMTQELTPTLRMTPFPRFRLRPPAQPTNSPAERHFHDAMKNLRRNTAKNRKADPQQSENRITLWVTTICH